MALIKCPECGGAVSTFAKTCPHCGFPMDQSGMNQAPQERPRFEQGMTFTFGVYPQTQVIDQNLIKILKGLPLPENGPFISHDGKRYFKAKKSFYLVEPIQWRILKVSDQALLAMSIKILDRKKYSSRTTRYEASAIRKWLTSDFVEMAFGGDDPSLLPYNIGTERKPVFDKVFLFSDRDLENPNYGFESGTLGNIRRQAEPTDYAVESTMRHYSSGNYYTTGRREYMKFIPHPRGDYEERTTGIIFVFSDGDFGINDCVTCERGVRPGILIKTTAFK